MDLDRNDFKSLCVQNQIDLKSFEIKISYLNTHEKWDESNAFTSMPK